MLEKEGIILSRRGIQKFINKYQQTGSIVRKTGTSPLTMEVMKIVDEQMRRNDETTAVRLLQIKGYKISLRTILRCRAKLGWTFRGSAYCQMVRDVNKVKRLEFARKTNEKFDDVIFTEECSVQLTSHRRFCCHKKGEKPKLKPRYLKNKYDAINK